MQLNDAAFSPAKHNIDTLRAAWRRTESGQITERADTDEGHEVEYYLTHALFNAQMRLGKIKDQLGSLPPALRHVLEAELTAAEDEIKVCAEAISVILQK